MAPKPPLISFEYVEVEEEEEPEMIQQAQKVQQPRSGLFLHPWHKAEWEHQRYE